MGDLFEGAKVKIIREGLPWERVDVAYVIGFEEDKVIVEFNYKFLLHTEAFDEEELEHVG